MRAKPVFGHAIELAPDHKTGLALNIPVMTAAGCWGFADEYADLVDFSKLGALVTNPITFHPRPPANNTQAIPIPSGTLVHTGLPNPGMKATVQKYAEKWKHLACPIIVHVAAADYQEAESCLDEVEGVENVVAVELGFPDDIHPKDAETIIMAAAGGMLPVITRLPFMRAIEFARISERAGAQVLTAAAPPRGTVPDKTGKSWISGRLYGTFVFSLALHLVKNLLGMTTLPVIASGGIHTRDQAFAFLKVGAAAIQLDSLVWTDPMAVAQIVAELTG